MSNGRSLETLTAEDFRNNLGTSFLLAAGSPESAPSAAVEVELVEVSEPAASGPGTFRAPFSLLFHGPIKPVMPQAIYRLEHERLGTFELFIVPIGPDEPTAPGQAPTAMRYEVVFG